MKCSYCDNEAKYSAWVYDNEPYEISVCVKNNSIPHWDEINKELKDKQRGMHEFVDVDQRLEKPTYSFEYDRYYKGWTSSCNHFFGKGNRDAFKTKEDALQDMLLGLYDISENRGLHPSVISPGYAKKEINKFRAEKKLAKKRLTRMRDILTEMLDCKDDTARARLYNEFNDLINAPYRSKSEIVLLYSQIINDPDYKY